MPYSCLSPNIVYPFQPSNLPYAIAFILPCTPPKLQPPTTLANDCTIFHPGFTHPNTKFPNDFHEHRPLDRPGGIGSDRRGRRRGARARNGRGGRRRRCAIRRSCPAADHGRSAHSLGPYDHRPPSDPSLALLTQYGRPGTSAPSETRHNDPLSAAPSTSSCLSIREKEQPQIRSTCGSCCS